jgi:CRP/FNR family transcriptional regulator
LIGNILVDFEFLKNIPFFSQLDDAILKELSTIAVVENFAAGDILFYEKDTQESIFYLLDGIIKFYKVDRFDNEIFLYKLSSNSLVFDISKFCDEYTISCYANSEFIEDSQVVIFENKKFREMIENNTKFMKIILNESFRMIQQFQCIISRNVVYDGTAKVAHMLAHDLETFNTLKKHEIAYMLHLQPETLSRILKKLIRNEVIVIEKNCAKIVKMNELQEIYE